MPMYILVNDGTTLPSTTIDVSESTTSGCEHSWIGDGYCDDTNNIMECSFDGGDCCGPNVNTAYCNQCQCLTGDNGVTTLQPSTTTSPSKIINSSNGLIKLFCNIIFIL